VGLFVAGRVAEAARQASSLVERFPGHGFGWKVLGVALKQMGRNAEALEPMRKAAELVPQDFEARTNLGVCLLESGALREAEAAFREALRANADYAKAHYNLGATLYALGRPADAEASYRRALRLKPDFAEAQYNLGVALHDLGRLEEAAASYVASLQADPGLAQAHNNLGVVLRKLGRFEDAAAHFEQALALDPGRDSARLGLCHTLYLHSLSDAARARELAAGVRARFPADAVVLRGISGILGTTDLSGDDAAYARKLFDGFASSFDAALGMVDYSAPAAIARELGLEDGKAAASLDILDAGCGTGLCAPHLRAAARRLVGVDLSPEMLRIARGKGLYDELHEADIVAYLRGHEAAFDLIVLADVLIYLGDVRALFASAFTALRPAGRIAMSAESLGGDAAGASFALHPSGRYQHALSYLEQSLREGGFRMGKVAPCTLRVEHGKPVAGWIVIAER
jgi:predicted TPR repeat methyltransferase